MPDELIIEKLKELYFTKVVNKQALTIEEVQLIEENLVKMRERGQIDDPFYMKYVVGYSLNPSSNILSVDRAEAIRSLQELESLKQVLDYEDNPHYTEYERLLYQIVNSPLSQIIQPDDKARLISEQEDIFFTSACFYSKELPSSCKIELLDSIVEQGYGRRNEYFQVLLRFSEKWRKRYRYQCRFIIQ